VARLLRGTSPPAVSRSPHIIGVRHHSPACARLVAARIRALRPAFVLIEGPADFNERLAELQLPHRLPLAIYSHLSDDQRHHGSWTPFAAHSPEWQALQVGHETGACVRFIDLPAWHDAFAGLENRYADSADHAHEARADDYEQALSLQLAVQGRDALWDHLFEDTDDDDALAEQLSQYFIHLRGQDRGSLGNQAREQMMAAWIAWAMQQPAAAGRPVLVVCGGYHAPMLQALWPQQPATTEPPPVPQPVDADSRHGSYLVPYSFKRLDAFAGYASGMPSPAWYEACWQHGQEAPRHLLRAVMHRLREKGLPASTADLIGVQVRAEGLARLRGHRLPQRVDWLDALAGALVKDALDAPLPWTYRGPLRAGTDPVLVQVMDVLAGDQQGELAPGTPQPPLLADVATTLAGQGLSLPGAATLDLLDPVDRARSRVLHQLALLQIPGVTRTQGPARAISDEVEERWTLGRPVEQHAALIEAGAWGATLHDAARARLESDLRRHGRDIARLVALLNRSAWAGLTAVSAGVLGDLSTAIAGAARFDALAPALGDLELLRRHGHRLGLDEAPLLDVVLVAGVDRALWLLEAPGGVAAGEMDAHVQGHQALRRIVLDAVADHAEEVPGALQIEPSRALAVWHRVLANVQAAPVSRGAALGALIGLAERVEGAQPVAAIQATTLLQQFAPAQVGDALAGLLALARDQLASEDSFTAGLDALVQGLVGEDFVIALPALRAAFAWLPPRERGGLATRLLHLHGATHLSSRQLIAAQAGEADPADRARAALAEREVLAALMQWGLAPTAEVGP